MNFKKILIMIFAVVFTSLLAGCGSTNSSGSVKSYPNKPIKILVGYEPGAATDTGARILAKRLNNYFDVDVVVENKPGGSGVVAMTELINSKPDGYTIAFSPNGPNTLQPHYGQTTYEYNDAEPISQVGYVDFFLAVHKDAPWDDVESLIEDVLNNPGKFTYGMPGAGSLGEIAMNSLAQQTGIEMRGVPFQGGTPTRTALLAKDIDVAAINEDSIIPYAEDGDFKILLNFGEKKFEHLPNIPTAQEKGLDINVAIGFSLYGPQDFPVEYRDKLDEAIRNTMNDESVLEELEKIGLPPIYKNAKETKQIIEDEYFRNKEIIEANQQ